MIQIQIIISILKLKNSVFSVAKISSHKILLIFGNFSILIDWDSIISFLL